MTRPASSAFVLDGEDIKARLIAERTESQTPVHVDWLRFTCYLRNNPTPTVERLFPRNDNIWDEETRTQRLTALLQTLPTSEFTPAAQALELAEDVCNKLGEGFAVAVELKKGHDFYAKRWSITRNDVEVGWVGFGASSSSPRQQAQARTLHCNLYGSACTFADSGWRDRMATLIDLRRGDVTRCDLALDFFDGLPGGMNQVREDYTNGLMDVGGRRLKPNMVGDWSSLAADYQPMEGRSFYFGSKEAGKQTNVYEKGHQLYGVDAGSPWIRVELRYGNKLRELSTDMLRRPADFFAGASDWHLSMVKLADAQVQPQSVPTTPRLALETVEAEVTRNLRWAFEVAAPTLAAAFEFLPTYDSFKELVTNKKLPGRLSKFDPKELARAFGDAIHRFTPQHDGPPCALAV